MGGPTPEERVHIWTRDKWRCFWCERPVILAQAMKYLAEEIGAERDTPLRGYYHENWKREEAPLLDELGAVVDKRDDTNPRTACWTCNTKRTPDESARVGSNKVNWDGMSGVFVFLAKQKRHDGGADDARASAAQSARSEAFVGSALALEYPY
jgi:hypothetical protein